MSHPRFCPLKLPLNSKKTLYCINVSQTHIKPYPRVHMIVIYIYHKSIKVVIATFNFYIHQDEQRLHLKTRQSRST